MLRDVEALRAAWSRRAAERGFDAQLASVDLAGLAATYGWPLGPFPPDVVSAILNAAEGATRRHTPRYRVVVASDGSPVLALDPLGRLDNGRQAWAAFREAAETYARRATLDQIELDLASDSSVTLTALATRAGASRASLYAWRSAEAKRSPAERLAPDTKRAMVGGR